MMKRLLHLALVLSFALCPCNAFALSEDENAASFRRHLEVVPPEGWIRVPMNKGLFDTCVSYALPTIQNGRDGQAGQDDQEAAILLLACPAAEGERTFADTLAEEKAEKGAISLGGSVLQSREGALSLFVPLKKGADGAMFLIAAGNPHYEGLLHQARPMLAAFRDFALPVELFGPDIDPLHYAGTFPFQRSEPEPELDALTLVWEDGKAGTESCALASILPHFPLWADVPKRLEWLECFIGELKPEGKHWKNVVAAYNMEWHAARSLDGKAFVVLRVASDDPEKVKRCQQMLDKFEW